MKDSSPRPLGIEQAIYGNAGGYRFLARSPGFRDEWLPQAELLCTRFGERPAGVSCPAAVFARPFAGGQVAVVQVADQGPDDTGRPGSLAFRILLLSRRLYEDLGGDPFLVADTFPPPWSARGEPPALEWTTGPPAPRAVAALQTVLQRSDSATLLGGTQALLDGGRLVFERQQPDPELVRGLWALLPVSTRAGLWPATFAFCNAHDFDVLVVPHATGPEYAAYVNETQAGDYPEGRYELALQIAVEAGDQGTVDNLLARRSRSQMMRLALALLVVAVLSPLGIVLLFHPAAPQQPPARTAAAAGPRLPPVNECPDLSPEQRAGLAHRLQALGQRLGLTLPPGDAGAQLTDDLAALDNRLGTPHPKRKLGPLRTLGPLQRQVRALLWKHDVADYNLVRLNLDELMDLLEQRLEHTGVLKEKARE